MSEGYDAIVVGARCAGSPTAMLLARKGYRVLLLDKATFPSDTMSTHVVHPPGVAALERWGLFERLAPTGCPPMPPEMQQLIGAMHGNQEAMDAFVSVQANTLPAPEFFAPDDVGRIMAQAGAAG
jgi:choline dehydrogenase-like flavoprotein